WPNWNLRMPRRWLPGSLLRAQTSKPKTQSKEQKLHHNSHGEKVWSCIFTNGEYSRSVLNVAQRCIRSPSENRLKLDHSYIVLIQRSTNLHKSKSHIQHLWTLNECAPERSS